MGSKPEPLKPQPQGPIFVLGKKDDYLHVAFTVKQAVEHTRGHLQAGLPLEDLEFFDVAGRELEPIRGSRQQLKDLAVKDNRKHIRARIRKMCSPYKRDDVGSDDSLLRLADTASDFDELGGRLAGLPVPNDENHFKGPGFFQRRLGLVPYHYGRCLHNLCHRLHLCR